MRMGFGSCSLEAMKMLDMASRLRMFFSVEICDKYLSMVLSATATVAPFTSNSSVNWWVGGWWWG